MRAFCFSAALNPMIFSHMRHISKRETVVYSEEEEEDWLVFVWHVHDDGYGTSMTA